MAEFLKRLGILFLIAGFLLGVFFASLADLSLPIIGFAVFLLVVVSGYFLFFVEHPYPRRSTLFLLSAFFLSFLLGVFRFSVSDLPVDPSLSKLVGQKTIVVGRVIQEPEDRNSYSQYVIEASSSSVRVLVRAEPFPKFEYADTLHVTGKLGVPESFETTQGRIFDYPAYLSKEGISYIVPFARVEKLSSASFSFRRSLFDIKNKFMSAIERAVQYPESGLLGGVLLGIQGGISKDLLDSFRIVGVIHIVVLSGYNITIVADAIRNSLSFFSRRTGLIVSGLGISVFILMVGAGPSVLRAGIMAMIALFARATRRTYEVAIALALAAFFMVLWNPKVLVFDLGFQLSFLATAALVWLAPFVEKKINFVPERLGLRNIAATTIAVQLFVMPLLVYSSGLVSISGFIVNLLVLPVVPLVMFLGFVTGLLSLISASLGFLPAVLTQAILSYIIWVSEFFAGIPGSALELSDVSPLVPIVFYALFLAAVVLLSVKREKSVLSGHNTTGRF